MSKQFVGFSDDDIYRIQSQVNGREPNAGKGFSRPHQRTAKPSPPVAAKVPTDISTNSCVDSSIYPNHPIQQAVAFKPLPVMMHAPQDESILVLPAQQQQQPQQQQQQLEVQTMVRPMVDAVEANTEVPLTPFKGLSLKDFEYQRKMMEEQNRQKRAMLHKAIEQHAQKTAAEASKIQEIKGELSKLDSELATDVAILRKQIDAASLHFSNVEKNYLNIENLFLKAKVDLHQALEKKEMLTEHLCAIISHNEERKARRLSELMEKVGISTDGSVDFENSELNGSDVSSRVDGCPVVPPKH